ncbi:RHS repeat-associated core domain-containing protein [Amycolatopsis cihanbeyliensis]|uniref:RHS repeat-associated core domain-containing protein n=1 Tax=Amycolatopsis cihanbeyliensis TaxID=1128664 RepID=UPI001FEA9E6F|nr:RHS repeat-associated core domain-containing protein [Amycolatopsis cihanbeyliensis]
MALAAVIAANVLVAVSAPSVATAAGGPSVPLPDTDSVPVSEQSMEPRLPDEVSRDALHGDQPAGDPGGGNAGSGTHTATSLSPSATWDVSAQTGSFAWSYPLRVPPAPGELTPELALSYSSSKVDGLTSASNTQASWVGDGWSFWPGFIERSYGSCAEDLPGEPKDNPFDLCWRSDNAMLSFGGSGSRLIRDEGTGVWRPEQDDGSRIERLTGAGNGDNNGEYWKVTDTEGTQYFYGSKSAAKSTWTVPVYGDDAGEPCHAGGFDDSFCTQAYRWNLDKVIDANGNMITYTYQTESNKYGRNKNDTPTSYVRGGWLERIEYGLRAGEPTPASGRVLLSTADRCVPGSTCTPDKEENWPEVPWRLNCDGDTCEDYQQSPSFWSTKRLSKITTQVRQDDGYRDVDSWTLRHEYPDPGDGEKPALWLAGVTHTGHVGGTAELPEVTFEGVKKPNRVKAIDGHAALIRYRMNAIVSESGGVTSIKYAEPDCSADSLPDKPETNSKRCFPVTWSAPYSAERTDYFHKYVVESVTQLDRLGSSVGDVTSYEYLDGAAWHYGRSELTEDEDKTWNEFRGFGRVRIRKGSGHDGPVTLTENRYFRGLNGDKLPDGTRSVSVTDSEGGSYPDHDWLSGVQLETITYNGEGGPVVGKTITEPSWQGPTATRGDLKAYLVNTGVERTITPLETGGNRITRIETEYDDKGMPTEVDDLGEVGNPEDDLCTRTSYARNTDRWLLSFPKQTETVSAHCGATPSYPDDAVSGTRNSYDGQTFGAAPTKGNVTRTEELSERTAQEATYVTTETVSYDGYGRPAEVKDALNRSTTTEYTSTAGGPVTKTVVTNAKGHATTTTLDPAWGKPVKVVDANGNTTEVTYDALGRKTDVWLPIRLRSKHDRGSYEYSYRISRDEPSVVTTTKVGPNGFYTTSKQLYDGLLRLRQTQTPAPGGGRLLTDTRYDSAGRTYYSTKPYFNDAALDDKLWSATDAEIPGLTVQEFDGAGRVVAKVFKGGGIEKWRTEVHYGGDRVHIDPPQGGTATTIVNDARGRTIELRQYHSGSPEGDYDSTAYTHTPAGELASLTDPGGNVWRYEYDLRGRKTTIEDPDKGVTTKSYDVAGQVTTSTDARDTTLAYAYDVLGRKTALHEGSLDGPKRAEWVYDTASWGKGKLAKSIRWINGEPYTKKVSVYDGLFRPLKTQVVIPESEEELAGTYTSYAAYHQDGSLRGIDYAAAGDMPTESYSTSYDDLGNPLSTSGGLNGQGITPYVTGTEYTRYGEVQRVQLGAGSKRTWLSRYYEEHTRRLARTIVDAELPQPMQSDVNYTYDPAGNITSIADTPREQQADVQCFRYDYLRRMTEAWTPNSDCAADPSTGSLGGPAPYWKSFSYDKVGNRVSATDHSADGDTVQSYTYPDGGHELNSVATEGPGGTSLQEFGYDETGNTVRRQVAGNEQDLEWDAEGNLVKTTEGEKVTEFAYDANGERLLRRTPDGATLYLPGQELSWDSASGETTTTRYYQHGSSTVAMRTDGAGVTWLLSDHQGTARFAVDAQAMQVTQRRQLPFGGRRGAEVDFPGEKGFVGGTIDESAGLVTLGARQYDPALGRFLSVDPLMDPSDPQQMHGYTYSSNNPITFSDPTGLAPRCDWHSCTGHRDPYPEANGRNERPDIKPRIGGESSPRRKSRPAAASKPSRKSSCTSVKYCGAKPSVPTVSMTPAEVAHAILDLAGLIPGLGEAADGVNCIWYGAEGDALNSSLSCAAMVPIGGMAATGGKLIGKSVDAGRGGRRAGCPGNSFVSGTMVLLADGTRKPIEDLELGDVVWASDPETGESGPRRVVATHVGRDRKDLVEITVDVDRGDKTGTIVATKDHPFWVDEHGGLIAVSSVDAVTSGTNDDWVTAAELDPGDELLTRDGEQVRVASVRRHTATRTVHNLTIEGIHTYHVLAGGPSLLVHNSNCPNGKLSDPLPRGMNNKIASAYDDVKAGRLTSHDTYAGREHRWWAGAKEYRVPGRPETERILEKELDNGVKVYGWTSTHYQKIQRFGAPHFPDSGWGK